MSSSDDGYGSMQELQNVGVVPNYKRTTALRVASLRMRPCGQRSIPEGLLAPPKPEQVIIRTFLTSGKIIFRTEGAYEVFGHIYAYISARKYF